MSNSVGVVLGNGPSREFFDFEGDCIIGCNIPGDGFSVDATVITDTEVVWVLKNNPELITCPIIASTNAYEKMKELKIDHLFDIPEVFRTRDWYTSGHYAAMYLTNIIKCDTVHIWGCDSYFGDTTESITDKHVAKSGGPFYRQWRQAWHDVFMSNPNVQFSIRKV